MVKLLPKKNANVNAQSERYSNALYTALEEGYKQVVKQLLKKNANVNAQGESLSNAL
jgi:ankyrin repeat protein